MAKISVITNTTKQEQHNVADQCKLNPKAFWKYISSKRKIKTSIGDLGTHEDERTVLYKTKTDDIVQTTQSTHTFANCM